MLRLTSVTWIVAAIVAGALAALLLGIGEHPPERAVGLHLAAGAVIALATGLLGVSRPSSSLAMWSVALAVVWVSVSLLDAPAIKFDSDRLLLVALPAIFPVLAGITALFSLSRRPRAT
jgi:hypothetical protein